MKAFLYIIISISIIIFSLIYFKIIEFDINVARWDKNEDVKLIDNSLSKTVINFVAIEQQSLLQNKTVILNYWGLGCAACIEEFPLLNGIAKYASKFDHIFCASVCSNASVEKICKLQKTKKYLEFNFKPIQANPGLLLSVNRIVARNPNWGLLDSSHQATPTTIVYNSHDSILFYKIGKLNSIDSLILIDIINQ